MIASAGSSTVDRSYVADRGSHRDALDSSPAFGVLRQAHSNTVGSSPHVDSLTALRGIASLFVVMLHAFLFFKVSGADVPRSWPTGAEDLQTFAHKILLVLFTGDAAVTLFFVLSGCVLAMSLERKARLDRATLQQFYIRRFFRIYPALWLANALGLLALLVVLTAGPSPLTTEWMRHEYASPVPWTGVVKGFLGFQSTLNQPLWSILVEIVFSALFPIIFWLSRRPVAAALTTGIAIGLLLMPLSIKYELDIHLLPFVVGAIIPTVVLGDRTEQLLRPWWPWLCIIAIAAIILPRGLLLQDSSMKSLCILLEVIGSSVLIFALLRRKVSVPVLSSRPALFLGDISYSIYLLHFPILFMAGVAFVAWVPAWIGSNGLLATLGLAAGTMALTIPVAALSYRLVEVPGQRLPKLLTRSRPLTTGLPTAG